MSNFIIFIVLLIIVLFIKSFKPKKKESPKLNYYKNYQFKKKQNTNKNKSNIKHTQNIKKETNTKLKCSNDNQFKEKNSIKNYKSTLEETKKTIKEINSNQKNLYNTIRAGKKKKQINFKEKGSLYEEYISNIYRSKNYNIAEHGKDNGVKDYGIDVIAKKENEILFIQCKNWSLNSKYKITVKEIQYTRMNVRDYIERNIMFKNYNWKIIYATSEDILDYGAKCKIKENFNEIEHKIIKI